MAQAFQTVAVISGNAALASVVSSLFVSQPGLRVRTFSTRSALTTYMRLSRVDLLIADFDSVSTPADQATLALRHDSSLANRDFRVLALTRSLSPRKRVSAASAGIDEVVVKPMSPGYLSARVHHLLGSPGVEIVSPTGYAGPDRRGRLRREARNSEERRVAAKVVPLFPEAQAPTA